MAGLGRRFASPPRSTSSAQPSAVVPAPRRRLATQCVTNFYPIHFQASSSGHLHIRIFHSYFYDVDADEPIRPREETELKRRIFEAPRLEGRQRAVEDALGVRCLEFGGDCAAGLKGDPTPTAREGAPIGRLVVDAVDRYEANHGGDWLPAVVRDVLGDGSAQVELYAAGSFWSEALNRSGPFTVPQDMVRPRRWEVYRGEALHVPDHETLVLYPGQHLWVRPRGPGNDEPAGRLVLGLGAGVRCEGGAVENEGVLECITTLQHPQHGLRRYKAEIESIKTLLVECLEGIPDLPLEERSVVLQCFTWIFERAYRHMQMRTLGGRGWYLTEEGETYPRAPERSFHREPERRVPPRVYLYRGFAATAVQVARGPCLKIDLSVRMIQGSTALSKLNLFRDMLIEKHRSRGWEPPTKDEMDAFLQMQMVGRSCMTKHNHIHYRIGRVCIDMSPQNTFPFEDGEISYLEYFQRRHGITLERRQPMLHCPFRAKQELYLPAEIAFLTGLDDDWKTDREFAQDLWKGLRHDPTEHWRLQSRLTEGLASAEEGRALRDWGVSVDRDALKVPCGELTHEPVYFSRRADSYFKQVRSPPEDLEISTSRQGFDGKPWPEVWTKPQARVVCDRWIIFCSSRPDERQIVDTFVDELEPLVGELLEADGESDRIVIAPPHIVEVAGKSPEEWADFFRTHRPPWRPEDTKFVFVVIPDKVRRRDQYYYLIKSFFSFQRDIGILSQVVLSRTLQLASQRAQIWKNILQQVLIKHGAWMWVISPLPYQGRCVMAVGIDACKQSRDSAPILTLCASTNPYFTTYFTTWRTGGSDDDRSAPGPPLKEALLYFLAQNRRLPDTLIIYRGGVSESQETALLEGEVYDPDGGVLETLVAVSDEALTDEEERTRWRERLEVAYILVRRGTNARFRTEDNANLPSGTYIDSSVVVHREEHVVADEAKRFDFYMVSQTYVIGTARPTLYSVLYSTLTFSRYEVMQTAYRLCNVYMTFSGTVSMPAPLKHAAKLLSLLSKCESVPEEPTADSAAWRPYLFFV